MNSNIERNYQICISVPLKHKYLQISDFLTYISQEHAMKQIISGTYSKFSTERVTPKDLGQNY